MDGRQPPSAREEVGRSTLVRTAQVAATEPDPVATLTQGLGGGDLALVCLFVTPDADFDALAAEVQDAFGATPTIACTTAGELGAQGYEEGQIVAVGFPAANFTVSTLLIEGLDALDHHREIDRVVRARMELAAAAGPRHSEFAFTLVDGMSLREDELTATLSSGLGSVPLFGGSAGDGTRFRATRLGYLGRGLDNAAVLALIRSDCQVHVFSLDHLVPGEARMVVTEADPGQRIVHRINAEPAAAEYARILGKDPAQLDKFTFAAHPVVVRLGSRHHVRAIREVTPDGALVFFAAIDEGMVLNLADPEDMVRHLDTSLAAFSEAGTPGAILACDCILRRVEAGQKQMTRGISEVLRRHRVVGFSTYGEQFGALHVNQTMTGVALYPPSDRVRR